MPHTENFKKLQKAIEKHYMGKIVPLKYRKEYGKVYSKKEASGISYAVAKSKGVQIDIGKQLDFGNNINLGKSLDLGK